MKCEKKIGDVVSCSRSYDLDCIRMLWRQFPECGRQLPNKGSEAGAATDNGSSADAVELSFWYGWTGQEGEAIEKLIAKWNAANPGIQVKGLSQSDYQKQLTAITGGNPPDIASQFGQNVVPWGLRGAMMTLDDYIARDGVDLQDFVPAALSTSQYEDKTYAIPVAMHVSMLFYNKDILAEAGFDGPPATIGELKEYIKALSIVEDGGRLQRLGLWREWMRTPSPMLITVRSMMPKRSR